MPRFYENSFPEADLAPGFDMSHLSDGKQFALHRLFYGGDYVAFRMGELSDEELPERVAVGAVAAIVMGRREGRLAHGPVVVPPAGTTESAYMAASVVEVLHELEEEIAGRESILNWAALDEIADEGLAVGAVVRYVDAESGAHAFSTLVAPNTLLDHAPAGNDGYEYATAVAARFFTLLGETSPPLFE